MKYFVVITPEEILTLELIATHTIDYSIIKDIIADDVYSLKTFVENMPVTIFYGDASSDYHKPYNKLAKDIFPQLPMHYGNIVITGAFYKDSYLCLDDKAVQDIKSIKN